MRRASCCRAWRRSRRGRSAGPSRAARVRDCASTAGHSCWRSRCCASSGCCGGGSDYDNEERVMARLFRRKEDVPKRSLWQRLKDIAMMDVGVLARGGVSAGSLEKLEELLIEGDFGVVPAMRLVDEVKRKAERGLV